MKIPGFWSEDWMDSGTTIDITNIREHTCSEGEIVWVTFVNPDPTLLE